MKSPLGYLGGKSRLVEQIRAYIPPDIPMLVSPFVGGGSVEIDQAMRGVRVKAYDAFSPVACFWHYQLHNKQMLFSEVSRYLPTVTQQRFERLQREIQTRPWSIEKAAGFFVLNRVSFNYLGLAGGMRVGAPRFNATNVRKIIDFDVPGFTVERADFRTSIPANPSAFLYCDPPYALGTGSKLYGVRGTLHQGFPHQCLFNLLRQRSRWLLSYNDSNDIRQLYRGFPIVRLKEDELLIGSLDMTDRLMQPLTE